MKRYDSFIRTPEMKLSKKIFDDKKNPIKESVRAPDRVS